MNELPIHDITKELRAATHIPIQSSVVIFGSARIKPSDSVYQTAQETARLLAASGYGIVTGGGPGIMEAANRGAQEGEGISVGYAIKLPYENGANDYVDVVIHFEWFFTRKVALIQISTPRAFIIFPGGLGTLDELFECVTLMQTGKIQRVPIVLFGSAFWGGLLDWMKAVMCTPERPLIALEDISFIIVDTPIDAYNAII